MHGEKRIGKAQYYGWDCRVATLLAMTEREIDSRFRGNDIKESGNGIKESRRMNPTPTKN